MNVTLRLHKRWRYLSMNADDAAHHHEPVFDLANHQQHVSTRRRGCPLDTRRLPVGLALVVDGLFYSGIARRK